ncbi:TIGR03663 family protein, partial [Halobacteriales archaeon QS_5_70_17]
DRRVVAAVGAIALLAVLARFLFVGARVAHWDEARVGYWILDYLRTGSYEYRPIIHGPFLQHANRAVFGVFGVSDATMRYVPALVGGLLPLTALLFRARLTDGETVALAGFLAANPVLLYYSRFMRGDLLVGAFMFAAFAFFLRASDTRRARDGLAGVGFTALGVTVKENAPVYVLCWLGAAAVVAWLRLVAARTRGERWLPDARTVRARMNAADGRRIAGTALAALAVFLAVVVLFYAPRGDGGATLGAALADPARFPAVVREATVGSYAEFHRVWGSGDKADHAYLPYFRHLLGTLAYGASVLCLFALVGFL